MDDDAADLAAEFADMDIPDMGDASAAPAEPATNGEATGAPVPEEAASPQGEGGADSDDEGLVGKKEKKSKKEKKDKKEKKEKKSKKDKKDKKSRKRKRKGSDEWSAGDTSDEGGGSDSDEPRSKRARRGGRGTDQPNKPKGKVSAYFMFMAEKREEIKAEFGITKSAELSKKIGDVWQSMSAEEKAPYQERADEDKARYAREMVAYQDTDEYKVFAQEKADAKATAKAEKKAARSSGGGGGDGSPKRAPARQAPKNKDVYKKQEVVEERSVNVRKVTQTKRLKASPFLESFDVKLIPAGPQRQRVKSWLEKLEVMRVSSAQKLTERLLRTMEDKLETRLKDMLKQLKKAAPKAKEGGDAGTPAGEKEEKEKEKAKEVLPANKDVDMVVDQPVDATPVQELLDQEPKYETFPPPRMSAGAKRRKARLSHGPGSPTSTIVSLKASEAPVGHLDGEPDSVAAFQVTVDSDDDGAASDHATPFADSLFAFAT